MNNDDTLEQNLLQLDFSTQPVYYVLLILRCVHFHKHKITSRWF